MQLLKEQHPVLPPCDAAKCRRKCVSKITEMQRNNINSQFWNLNWKERRSFILNYSGRVDTKKPSVEPKRKNTYIFSLCDEGRQRHRVCKPFF